MDRPKYDDVLMVICSESPGCFEIEPESGEPLESCVYSELINLGYTSDSLASADDKDSESIVTLDNAISPNHDVNETIDKMHPECIKLMGIIQNAN